MIRGIWENSGNQRDRVVRGIWVSEGSGSHRDMGIGGF